MHLLQKHQQTLFHTPVFLLPLSKAAHVTEQQARAGLLSGWKQVGREGPYSSATLISSLTHCFADSKMQELIVPVWAALGLNMKEQPTTVESPPAQDSKTTETIPALTAGIAAQTPT